LKTPWNFLVFLIVIVKNARVRFACHYGGGCVAADATVIAMPCMAEAMPSWQRMFTWRIRFLKGDNNE
jgi:hypothetical protein